MLLRCFLIVFYFFIRLRRKSTLILFFIYYYFISLLFFNFCFTFISCRKSLTTAGNLNFYKMFISFNVMMIFMSMYHKIVKELNASLWAYLLFYNTSHVQEFPKWHKRKPGKWKWKSKNSREILSKISWLSDNNFLLLNYKPI